MGDNFTPHQLQGNPVWLSVSAGDETVCGLARDYTLRCWGKNEFGQLGLGDRRNRGSRAEEMENLWPIDLGALVTSRCSHRPYLCFDPDQNVLCWGRNGTGASVRMTEPVVRRPTYCSATCPGRPGTKLRSVPDGLWPAWNAPNG